MDRLLYSIPEACRYLSLSRSKVYALMSSGRLRSVKIDGARRLRAVDLAEYVESLSTPATFDRGSDPTAPRLFSPGIAPSIRSPEPRRPAWSSTPEMSSSATPR